MIGKLLIANRGEIAVRIARTCRELGIATIAVYSDADRRALHVLEADIAVYIGPSLASESYLNIEAIVRAALDCKADAVHPGYGLLSENADFAEACAAAGLTFVGPPAAAIRAMGDKAEARKLALSRGVPTVPGYEGDSQAPAKLLAAAKSIGFPVMIKAALGGGGRGMRFVDSEGDFQRAVDGARLEAERAFGDGRLLLERAIVGGRHIEVQVLADSHGNVVHLGERDCSVQRRHQKVVEETPSPAVDPDLRGRIGEAACQLSHAADYVSAGTVEFLLDAAGKFYFLEMNTRLQVEHGVTEMVTGLDLVALQIAIAQGEPLPFEQNQVQFSGHAIECRVYAEDPLHGYLPSPGRIVALELPAGEGIRNDVGTYAGDEITTFYDPMIAKLLAWGPDRNQAIVRMDGALGAYRVAGLKTNLSLLRAVLAHPVFRAGRATTDFLDVQATPGMMMLATPEAPLLAAFGALVLGLGATDDPWSTAGPWWAGVSRVDFEHDGVPLTVEGRRLAGSRDEWLVTLAGRERRARFTRAASGRILVESEGATEASYVTRAADGIDVTPAGGVIRRFSWAVAGSQPSGVDIHRERALTAPMPGLIIKVFVRPGEKVRAHQALVVLEAMKMEHAIEAPYDGIVKNVHCAEGGRVAEGVVLVEVEPEKPA